MKYDRFEQLPAWKAAMELAEKVYSLTGLRAFDGVRELRDQMRRAALSVSNNIAEGFERGTTAELLAFLYIARGSAGEVRSMLIFCRRMKSEISNLRSQISDYDARIEELMKLAESCSRQIRAWADHLQNTDIDGQRRLNDKTRAAWQGRKSSEAFLEKLQEITAKAQAERQEELKRRKQAGQEGQ